MSRLTMTFAWLVVAVGLTTGPASGARLFSAGKSAAPLRVVAVATPKVPFPHIDTSGTYPQVRSAGLDLGAVNSALRQAVLADERGRGWSKGSEGQYWTYLDPSLISASTAVVSVLMLSAIQTNPYRPWRHWLSATIRVPNGRSVKLRELFASDRGIQVFGNAWRRFLPHGERGCVSLDYVGGYSPGASYFRDFALTPEGLAAGVSLGGGCSGLVAVVPYSVLRPHLSELGARLVAGVRRPTGPLEYALCHGGSAAKTPTGRSSVSSGSATFTGSCRYGKWYISAQIDGRQAARFPVAAAKVNGQSPCCGVEILKVVRLPESSPVALARVALGFLNGFGYDLFTVMRGRVVPVTLKGTRTPVVLNTHGSVGWGEGFRCLSQRGRLTIDSYRWGTNTFDGKGHVKVERWRYTFETATTMRPQKIRPIVVSYKAVGEMAGANCFGVHDPV